MLTSGERKIAASIFGDASTFRNATIALRRNSALQSHNLVLTFNERIYVRPSAGLWSEDYAAEGPPVQGMFVHQLAHVWQFKQLGRWRFLINYLRDLARCGYNQRAMYHYAPGITLFHEATLEAQAQMLGDLRVARLTSSRERAEQIEASLTGTRFPTSSVLSPSRTP
ncbi:MAG TPA: hypothetical protein VGB79_08100 [Allosphingosinicella sp.]